MAEITEEQFIKNVRESIKSGVEYLAFLAKELIENPLDSPGVILEMERVIEDIKKAEMSYLIHFPKEKFKPFARDKYKIVYQENNGGTHYVLVPIVEENPEEGEKDEKIGYR